jgi:protein O-mannosyl-transferase
MPWFTERQFGWLLCLSIVFLGILAFWNTLSNEFVWDDASSVQRHEHVQDPSKVLQLFREDLHAFGRGQGNFYRPLVALSFMIDYAFSHPSTQEAPPGGRTGHVSTFLFHMTNLAWHVAAALLLLALLTRLAAPRFVRATVPAIFAIHPLQTEAVSYISGRADPMSTAFMFAALWFALWTGSKGKRTAGAALSGLCFVGALLSKESAVILPFLLLLFVFARPVGASPTPSKQSYVQRLLPFFVCLTILVVYAVLRFTVLHFGTGAGIRDVPFTKRIIETGQALALYVKLFFVPTGLHMERTLDGVPSWISLLGILVLAAMGLMIVDSIRRRCWRAVLGLGWFLITWFPVSGLIPLNAPMAEHWMYLPLAGFFWGLAEYLWPFVDRRGLRIAAGAAVYGLCLFFIVLTIGRNADWRTNETLYRATLAHNPQSIRVNYNLAVTYEDILNNPAGARRHYEKVVQLRERERDLTTSNLVYEDEMDAHLSLGEHYFENQMIDQAAHHYGAVLRHWGGDSGNPIVGSAAFGMAQCFLAVGNVEQARQQLELALQGRPDLEPRINTLLQQLPRPKT